MDDWRYAANVPTSPWRGTATIPRDIRLIDNNGELFLGSKPVADDLLINPPVVLTDIPVVDGEVDLSSHIQKVAGKYQLKMNIDGVRDLSIVLSNDIGEQVVVGFNKSANQYYVDRTKSGLVEFDADFGKFLTAPRLSDAVLMDYWLIVDVASMELFADHSLKAFSVIFFPNQPYLKLKVRTNEPIAQLVISGIQSIWPKDASVTKYY